MTNKIIWREEQCFMIMPFAEKYNEIYNIIQRAAKKCEINIVRADTKNMPLPISTPFADKIKGLIKNSYYIIADISDLNANVLYELGLAHALLPEENVLIIMDDSTKCPSDLQHINYFKYASHQLSKLYDCATEFLGGDAYKNDLINHLERYDLISNKVDKKVFLKTLGNETKDLLKIINHSSTIEDNSANILLNDLYEKSISNKNELCYRECYHKLLIFVLRKLISTNNLDVFIDQTLNTTVKNNINDNKELKAEIAIEIIEKLLNQETTLKWIKELLKTTPTTSVDNAKYTIMLGLLKNNKINNHLINILWSTSALGKENQLLLEEILELCESKILSNEEQKVATNAAINLIKTTNNEFVFKAAIDLLIKIDRDHYPNILYSIKQNKNYETLCKFNFIQERIKKLNEKTITDNKNE